jgi:hypothetical protein
MTETEAYDPIPESVDDALAKWDAGETVFTVEMGGLGPGYEMAIQGLAFELMREFKGFTEWDDDEARKTLEPARDAVMGKLNNEPWAGFSGAQVGAATNLAACVCKRGYRAAMRDPAVADRLIQVSKRDLRA